MPQVYNVKRQLHANEIEFLINKIGCFQNEVTRFLILKIFSGICSAALP